MAIVEILEEDVEVELRVHFGDVDVELGPETFGEAEVVLLQDLTPVLVTNRTTC